MKKRANVALIIETAGVYGRQILRGISRHLHAHGGWSVFLEERERKAPSPQWLLDWDGDGIICRSTTPELAAALRERAIPTVDLNDYYGFLGLPYVASDMNAIGEMAARHLLERGFERVAFCGFAGEAWSQKRLVGVQKTLGAGAQLHSVFESPWNSRNQNWQQQRVLLCQWIETLTFPVGIIACNDLRGQHVIDACRMLGVRVPEQVAVVGVDNSEMLCNLCDPPLSSVMPGAQQIGFEAAALLARLMNEQSDAAAKDRAPTQIFVPPTQVVTRQSSDVWAVDDPAIARALHFIRERACEGISVEEVAAHVRMSRSTLERNFRRWLNCSPQQEIRRVRLNRVQQLLRETDLPLASIAELAGYAHPEYMMVQFKNTLGQTPSQWRVAQAKARAETNLFPNRDSPLEM